MKKINNKIKRNLNKLYKSTKINLIYKIKIFNLNKSKKNLKII